MGGALISDAAVEHEAPAPTPVIPQSVVEENLRRIKAGAKNTLIRVNADGTRSYFHDVVSRGDGVIDTLRTDRGDGTRDSLDMLEGGQGQGRWSAPARADEAPRRSGTGRTFRVAVVICAATLRGRFRWR